MRLVTALDDIVWICVIRLVNVDCRLVALMLAIWAAITSTLSSVTLPSWPTIPSITLLMKLLTVVVTVVVIEVISVDRAFCVLVLTVVCRF